MPTFQVTAQVRETTNPTDQLVIGKVNQTVTPTGTGQDRRVVNVGTTEESFTLSSDIGDAGLMVVENLDDTNYVQLGFATGAYYIRLDPGVPMVLQLEPTVSQLFMKANAAACDVMFHALEA